MRLLLSVLLALLVASPVVAASLQRVRFPTPGLEGYETHVLGLQAEPWQTLRGFDATFMGPMHQVNPAGAKTVFQDLNALFPFIGALPVQDSQFLFNENDIFSLYGEESETLLAAPVLGLNMLDLPNPIPFAQIVTDRPGEVRYGLFPEDGATDYVMFQGTLRDCFLTEFFDASFSVEAIANEPDTGLTTYLVTIDLLSNHGGVSVLADFSGSLSQSAGGETAFQSDLPEAERPSDSHFLFDREGLLIPIEEDAGSTLRAAFNVSVGDGMTAQVPLAQIVTDDPASIQFDLFVGGCSTEYEFSGFLVPEPTAAVMLTCLLAAFAMKRRAA